MTRNTSGTSALTSPNWMVIQHVLGSAQTQHTGTPQTQYLDSAALHTHRSVPNRGISNSSLPCMTLAPTKQRSYFQQNGCRAPSFAALTCSRDIFLPSISHSSFPLCVDPHAHSFFHSVPVRRCYLSPPLHCYMNTFHGSRLSRRQCHEPR